MHSMSPNFPPSRVPSRLPSNHAAGDVAASAHAAEPRRLTIVADGDRMAAAAVGESLRVSLPGWQVAEIGCPPAADGPPPGATVLLWKAGPSALAALAAKPFRYRIALACREPVGSVALRAALKLAPHAVVSREESPEALVAAVQSASEGLPYVSPRMQPVVGLREGRLTLIEDRGAAALTGRQCEVLRMFALGYSIRETAAELGLTDKTVESHRYRVCKRLGTHDRSALVSIAIREGLLTA